MKTADYISAAKNLLKINSAELSRRLNVTDASLSRYESGERLPDNYTAMRLAEILKINPLRIIAQAEIEREKTLIKQNFWFVLRDRLNDEAKRNKEILTD
jgi:transcriptional regulator with XRE-family HTH domain